MNTGQMLITLAALTLVMITTLNHNRTSMATEDNMIYSKEFILAASVAESMLDEISGKAYDEEIVKGKTIISASDFSSNLGKDGGETYPDFDDIDDYNNFSKTDSIPNMGIFTATVSVEYMSDDLIPSVSKTYNKNVTVRVTSPNLFNILTEKSDTMVVQSLYSQWKML